MRQPEGARYRTTFWRLLGFLKPYKATLEPEYVTRPTIGYTRNTFGNGFTGSTGIVLGASLGLAALFLYEDTITSSTTGALSPGLAIANCTCASAALARIENVTQRIAE